MSRRNQQHHPDEESEAEEVKEEINSNSEPLSQEEPGEDLLEDPQLDYQPIPELDRYQPQDIDDKEYPVNPEERKAAQNELEERDWKEDGIDDIDYLLRQQDQLQQELKNKRMEFYEANLDDSDDDQPFDYIDPEEEIGPMQTWIVTNSVRKYIKRRLTKFFFNFRIKNKAVYYSALKNMCINNHQSLVVDYLHLKTDSLKLAEWLVRYPQTALSQYNCALYSAAKKVHPSYGQLFKQCFFKIENLPVIDSLRTLSYTHLGLLVKVRGVITSVSLTLNELRQITYKCQRCGYLKGPFFLKDSSKIELGICHSCHGYGPFKVVTTKSVYRNFQKIQLQESPSTVDPGRIPRGKEVIALGDNVDCAKPGEQVQITGIFTTRYDKMLNIKQGFPIFHTLIQANNIQHIDKITCETTLDEEELQQIPKSKNFPQNIYESIAPSIYGHHSVKKAITLSLFGGIQKKNEKKNHRIRGDINLLLLGDPGIAKSQLLKSVQKVFPRCVYTTGKGASAVGLTASVIQDKMTKDWRLEAGALVLADKGVCLIDEFDKMSQQDRTSIHEAMEQQTISISKAGIVATLNARCSVIAAANPNNGVYNQRINFKDNVELSQPILSRFDILCVLKDRASEEIDGRLAEFVIGQHMKNHPYQQKYTYEGEDNKREKEEKGFILEPDYVKQYIRYARQKIKPKITPKTTEIIKDVYLKLREFSQVSGGIDIVVRHLESMIRIAEAHAKMHLRKETNEFDAKVAVSVMIRSFIQTQRQSTADKIIKAFRFYLMPQDFPQKK